jgi:hypothetical protein
MARCHYTHLVDPHVVSWEIVHMAKLLERHVDNLSADFEILTTVDTMKDYVKAYFVGTVASGLAYLSMANEGYVWSDHWENVARSHQSGTRKSPDFIFAGPTFGLSLMESKGTRGDQLRTFDRTVSRGYTDQVEPHLGKAVGGIIATNGYCIGSHLTGPSTASFRIDHTALPAGMRPSAGLPALIPSAVLRHNYGTAFSLVHGPWLGEAIRRGSGGEAALFLRFKWAGRTWVTSKIGLAVVNTRVGKTGQGRWRWALRQPQSSFAFALLERVAEAALGRFLASGREDSDDSLLGEDEQKAFLTGNQIERVAVEASAAERSGMGGVIFRDGLAVISQLEQIEFDMVAWSATEARFVSFVS